MDKSTSSWRMLWVNDELCANCRLCLAQQGCRIKALVRFDHDEPPFVDVHRCRGCRVCMSDCPSGAIGVK